ncbi:MAG: hypothetical protein AAF710_06545 [Planctomycetota bacterium]
MLLKVVTLFGLLTVPLSAHAVTATFEEFGNDEEVVSGNTFVSVGLTFEVFTPADANDTSSVKFFDNNFYPLTTGTYAALDNWDGVTLQLTAPVTNISFDYVSGFPDLDLIINGVAYDAADEIDFVASGVAVNFTPDGGSAFNAPSFVELTGPIASFGLSGTELAFDNFTVVPEPASLALVIGSGLPLLARRRVG